MVFTMIITHQIRISSIVKAMTAKPNILLAGSSKVFMYSTREAIYRAGPINKHVRSIRTLAFRPSYLKNHAYDKTGPCAVEVTISEGLEQPMIRILDNQILHMIHSSNTYKKRIGYFANGGGFRW
jgi:hypothetical protein